MHHPNVKSGEGCGFACFQFPCHHCCNDGGRHALVYLNRSCARRRGDIVRCQGGRPGGGPQISDGKERAPSVDVELVIAVDVSYSMDMDELAVQREGYAQAIVSREFLHAMKSGPMARSRLLTSSGRHLATRRS